MLICCTFCTYIVRIVRNRVQFICFEHKCPKTSMILNRKVNEVLLCCITKLCIVFMCRDLKVFTVKRLWVSRGESGLKFFSKTEWSYYEGEWAHNFYYTQYSYAFYIYQSINTIVFGFDVHKSRAYREMRWPFIMFFIRSNKSVKWYVVFRWMTEFIEKCIHLENSYL